MHEQFAHIDIILASQSPRRRELLEMTGLRFRVVSNPVHEDYPTGLSITEIAEYLSKQKALPFEDTIKQNTLIITADTIVAKDHHILNKASDELQAYEMLKLLSGATHKVVTGVCLTSKTHQTIFHEITHVTFKTLSDEEIHYYIKKCKPFDKAGAYGIQEWIGAVAVTKIEGSYYNVVGLPTARLISELQKFAHAAFGQYTQKC